jgi:hypothetical protein
MLHQFFGALVSLVNLLQASVDFERHNEFVMSDKLYLGLESFQTIFKEFTYFERVLESVDSLDRVEFLSILGSRIYLLCRHFQTQPDNPIRSKEDGGFELYDKVHLIILGVISRKLRRNG